MAPTSPDNTARAWLDYTVAGQAHSQQMRVGVGVSDADVITAFDAAWTEMDSQLLECTITGLRRAAAGTNVSFPVTWTGPASYGSGAGDPYQSANYYDFIGRGVTGKRCRVSWFGTILSQFGGDYRLVSSESTIVADTITALQANASCFLDITGSLVAWHPYADVGVNAYWRNQIR